MLGNSYEPPEMSIEDLLRCRSAVDLPGVHFFVVVYTSLQTSSIQHSNECLALTCNDIIRNREGYQFYSKRHCRQYFRVITTQNGWRFILGQCILYCS